MNINFYINQIKKYVEEYKAYADELGKQYKIETEKIKSDITEMREKYTEQYIDEYISRNTKEIKINYQSKLLSAQNEKLSCVEPILSTMKKCLNAYFATPASDSFVSILNLISLSGMSLDDAEIKFLKENANTYFERKALGHIIDKMQNDGLYHENKIELPDMGSIFKLYEQFSEEAIDFISNYTGNQMILSEKPLSEKETWVASTKCHFFENETGDKLAEKYGETITQCKIDNVKVLTDADREMIDCLVDPKYPTMAKEQVVLIAKASPELASKLILDERYTSAVMEAIGA